MFENFKVLRGLSTDLFDEEGNLKSTITLELGCWYLCTDIAVVYVCVEEDNILKLKRLNDIEVSTEVSAEDLGAVSSHAVYKAIEEIKDELESLPASEEVYILNEGETEENIPPGISLAIFPDEEAEEIDLSIFYTKSEVDEIITKTEDKLALPVVSTIDDGKVLKAQDGAWTAQNEDNPEALSNIEIEELLKNFI